MDTLLTFNLARASHAQQLHSHAGSASHHAKHPGSVETIQLSSVYNNNISAALVMP